MQNDNITDVSYNGSSIFYMDNIYGRKKFDCEIKNKDVLDFLRQISNLTNVPFSMKDPLLDVSFDFYRLNASFYTISKKGKTDVVTFSLRIFSKIGKINKNSGFFPKEVFGLLQFFLSLKFSFLIAGLPSSGKSEFQKYLINSMCHNERVVIVDTIDELDIEYNNSLDVTLFVASDEKNISINDLLKLSLRYNPDYLVVAEARGSEFEQILTSSLSGISTITTLHAKDVTKIVERCINMVQIKNKNLDYEIIKNSILDHFNVLVYTEKILCDTGEIIRHIKNINFIYKRKIYVVLEYKQNHYIFNKLPDDFLRQHQKITDFCSEKGVFYE